MSQESLAMFHLKCHQRRIYEIYEMFPFRSTRRVNALYNDLSHSPIHTRSYVSGSEVFRWCSSRSNFDIMAAEVRNLIRGFYPPEPRMLKKSKYFIIKVKYVTKQHNNDSLTYPGQQKTSLNARKCFFVRCCWKFQKKNPYYAQTILWTCRFCQNEIVVRRFCLILWNPPTIPQNFVVLLKLAPGAKNKVAADTKVESTTLFTDKSQWQTKYTDRTWFRFANIQHNMLPFGSIDFSPVSDSGLRL